MNARNALFSIACGFLGAFLFSLLPHSPKLQLPVAAQDQVTAQAYNLVDSSGRLRAQLSFAKEGPPAFWLFDQKGQVRLTFGLYEDDTSYFGLQDKSGEMIELMRSYGPKEAPLLIFKMDGQNRMITGLNPGAIANPFLISYPQGGPPSTQFGKYDGP